MKKIFFALSAAMLLMTFSSCNNKQTETTTSEVAEQSTAATEQAPATPMSPAELNAQAGKQYLDSLKANDKDVKFTDSGLGYKEIKAGSGANPSLSNTVTVRYTGKHIDGSVFDSSGDNTIDFPLTQVIPGFSEGITKMNKGAVYELYIPSNLGYGPRGAAPVIGPNETLIFEIELVDFK